MHDLEAVTLSRFPPAMKPKCAAGLALMASAAVAVACGAPSTRPIEPIDTAHTHEHCHEADAGETCHTHGHEGDGHDSGGR